MANEGRGVARPKLYNSQPGIWVISTQIEAKLRMVSTLKQFQCECRHSLTSHWVMTSTTSHEATID